MSGVTQIILLVIGVAGLLWVGWLYYLEAKRCYTEDMLAQKRTRAKHGKLDRE